MGYEGQLQRSADEAVRLAQKSDQLIREHRQAMEEREALDRRQDEARLAIGRLEQEQRSGDERFTLAQHRLFGAREAAEDLSQRAAEARATHAGLVERAAALHADVRRLEESAVELEQRADALAGEIDQVRGRIERLRDAVSAGEAQLDTDVLALEELHRDVRTADDAVSMLRAGAEAHEGQVKEGRAALESIRAIVSELAIALATAEGDLSHLSASCLEAVQSTLDEVVVEVEQLEREGAAIPDARALAIDDVDESTEDGEKQIVAGQDAASAPLEPDLSDPGAAVIAAERHALSAEEAIAALREDRPPRSGEHDGDRAVRRARDPSRVPVGTAEGSGGRDRAYDRGDQANRPDYPAAVCRRLHGDQPQLPADIRHLVRRWPGGLDITRRKRPARAASDHRPAARQALAERAAVGWRREGAYGDQC